jgi:hypothetical protein
MLSPMTAPAITIRPEYPDDELALNRLAMLDSADNPPPRPLLLAEVDGELRVALSLRDGSAIADPFHPTAALLALLSSHAHRTNAEPRRSARRAIRAVARGMRTGRRTPAWSR